MKISVHTMAVDSFAPMLESLSSILDKAATYAEQKSLDLVQARLAPDMFTLGQQVQLASHYAWNGVSRLTGRPEVAMSNAETTLAGLKAQIAGTIDLVHGVPADEFEGAETRDCSIDIPNGMVIEVDRRSRSPRH